MHVDTLPALTGSAKQIAWATAIRQQTIADIEAGIARYPDRVDADVERAVQDLLSITDSRFWIDARYTQTVRGKVFRMYVMKELVKRKFAERDASALALQAMGL